MGCWQSLLLRNRDRKSTRLNSSHGYISYAVFCLKKKISITRLASATDRPGQFIGMHFMNPVPVMSLVELIRGIATDEATFNLTRDLAVKLRKTPVMAEDFPAFIVNRILLPMINEAVYTLYE